MDVRASLEDVIRRLMVETPPDPNAEPSLTPAARMRGRQLGTLAVLSGDKAMGRVGEFNLGDIEKDVARGETLAARREASQAMRLQGGLGLLSARDIAESNRVSREQIAEGNRQTRETLAGLARANRPDTALTVLEDSQGKKWWSDPRTGEVLGEVGIGLPPIRGAAATAAATNPAQPGAEVPDFRRNRPVSEKTVSDITNYDNQLNQFGQLNEAFKPSFAGSTGVPMLGKAENVIGRMYGSDASNFWKRYQNWFNETLKTMSGTAVTKAEMDRFESAQITPDTPVNEIRRNLVQQQQALTSARNKRIANEKAAGFNVGNMPALPEVQGPKPGAFQEYEAGGIFARGTPKASQQGMSPADRAEMLQLRQKRDAK